MLRHGIYVPNVVPLRADGSLDEDGLRRHIAWLAERGVDGIFANGSTGEFVRFTEAERRRTVELVAEAGAGRLGLIAGAVEATPELTLAACRHYAGLGCDAVSLCPPPYFRPSQEALREHYLRLADRSPVPVLLYQIPAFVAPLSHDTLCELARHPRIIGLKDSSRDLAGFLTLMQEIRGFRPDFAFFTGTEELLLPALVMGAAGGTIATAGCLPEAVVGLRRAWLRGDLEGARRLQLALLPLIRRLFSVDFPLGFRAAVELRGFDLGPCRQPLAPGQEKALARLKEDLRPLMDGLLAGMGAGRT